MRGNCTLYSIAQSLAFLSLVLIPLSAVKFGLGKHLSASDQTTGYKILQVSRLFLLDHGFLLFVPTKIMVALESLSMFWLLICPSQAFHLH